MDDPPRRRPAWGPLKLPVSQARLDDRRRRLVATAQSLLRERYDAGFSMGELARRAGVSPATPYNLVGNRAEILQLVVEEEYRRLAAKLPNERPLGALRALLDAIDVLVAHYDDDRNFCRTAYRVIRSSDLPDVTETVLQSGGTVLRGFVRAAVDAGELSATVAVETFADILVVASRRRHRGQVQRQGPDQVEPSKHRAIPPEALRAPAHPPDHLARRKAGVPTQSQHLAHSAHRDPLRRHRPLPKNERP
jgi:AcrR family transcriptional regulator